MSTIRILHISDLHIADIPCMFREDVVANPLVLLRLASKIHENWALLDAIIITGDVADSGKREDLLKALNFLLVPGQPNCSHVTLAKQPTLYRNDPKPIYVIPGNHDRFVSYRKNEPMGGGFFDEIFKNYWGSRLGGVKTFFFPNIDSPELAIIGADFTLRSESDASGTPVFKHFGLGEVYPDRLVELVEETRKVQKECPVVWATHFAPDFFHVRDIDKNLALCFGGNLITAAAENGVKHIFCGHTHKCSSYKTFTSDDVIVHCSGSSACDAPGEDTVMHIRSIELCNNDIVNIFSDTFRWSELADCFVEEKSCKYSHCNGMCIGCVS